MPTRLFTERKAYPPEQKAMAERLLERSAGRLADAEAAMALLRNYVLPPSLRWAYCRNGKTGSTTVLDLLFRAEFGAPLTAELSPSLTLNQPALAHHVIEAGILRPAIQKMAGLKCLGQAFKITTVRHPMARAISSFRYLCLSGQKGAAQFVNERMRINAETGFDWTRDPLTARGFLKYLDYVEILHETANGLPDVIHWRAQAHNIRPDVLAPDLIGKVEDFPSLYRALQDRFGEIGALPHLNTQGAFETGSLLSDPAVLPRLTEVFAIDFETFGYDPAAPLTGGPA